MVDMPSFNDQRGQLLLTLLAAHQKQPTSPWMSVVLVSDAMWPIFRDLVYFRLVEHSGSLIRLTDAGMAEAERLQEGG